MYKIHANVLRDRESMLEQLQTGELGFESTYTDTQLNSNFSSTTR